MQVDNGRIWDEVVLKWEEPGRRGKKGKATSLMICTRYLHTQAITVSTGGHC